MVGCIYKITNILNGNIYIGQTINFRKRKQKHIQHLKKGTHYNSHLQASFNKYGESVFQFEIITNASSKKELNDLEKKYIKEIPSKKCYNFTSGGEGTLGYKHTEKTKKKISEAWNSPNSKMKLPPRLYGVENPKSVILDEDKIISLYKNGFSCSQIAENEKCSGSTIRNVLIRNKITLRNERESPRRGMFGYRGGYFRPDRNKNGRGWICQIRYKKSRKQLGQYHDPLTCEIVYNLVKEEIERI